MTKSAKHYCFTLNNHTDQDVDKLRKLANEETTTYLIFGYERGESGTPHLQGFISFTSRRTFKQAKALINARAHLEPAKGSPAQNRKYCTKDGKFEEFGECPVGQGRRSDLEGLVGRIRSGEQLQKIAEEYPGDFVRYGRGIRFVYNLFSKQREGSVTIICFIGESGSGKTARVYKTEPDLYRYSGGHWFDGYDGQEAALFDDFGGHEFKLTFLLQLLDQYPMMVPVKGDFVHWKPRRIYLTSNIRPEHWYRNISNEHHKALMRRIHIIISFFSDFTTRRDKPL